MGGTGIAKPRSISRQMPSGASTLFCCRGLFPLKLSAYFCVHAARGLPEAALTQPPTVCSTRPTFVMSLPSMTSESSTRLLLASDSCLMVTARSVCCLESKLFCRSGGSWWRQHIATRPGQPVCNCEYRVHRHASTGGHDSTARLGRSREIAARPQHWCSVPKSFRRALRTLVLPGPPPAFPCLQGAKLG